MGIRNFLGGFLASTKHAGDTFRRLDREPRRATTRRPSRLLILETLEDRTVPTVLFAPQFGNESLLRDGGQRINSPNLYVVLWGSSWGSLVSPATQLVFDETSGVVGSHYLDGLSQYGVTTTAHYKDHIFDNTPDPLSGFSQQSMIDEMGRLIRTNQLPNPAFTPNMIVDMVTAPGITSDQVGANGIPAAGYNNAGFLGDFPFGGGYAGYIWNGTSFGSLPMGDACSLIFSHELAETMTDPGGQGYEVTKGTSWPGAAGAPQIGDCEGNQYQYRMSNEALVQPYWSGAKNSPYPNQWLVTDGNSQTLNVKPNWIGNSFQNYDLTLNRQPGKLTGDSLAIGKDDYGLTVVFNSERFQMDSVQLHTFTANVATGITAGLVQINDSPIMAGITINGSGGPEVRVGGTQAPVSINGAGTVNIGTGNLQTIRSSVTVTNSGGYSAVTVDDSADHSARTVLIYNNGPANGSYTVIDGFPSAADIVLRGSQLSSLAVRAGNGGNTFRIHDTPFSNTPGGLTTTVSTGGGNDLVTVDGTTGILKLDGAGGSDTVNIGTGSLQTIRNVVTVTNSGGYSAVTVDDSADHSARTVLIYNNGPANGSYTVIDGLPSGGDIVFRGPELSSLAVRAGSGGNTFRIHDTPISNAPGGLLTTVSTGGGNDLVTVDGTTGPLSLDGAGGSDTVNLGTGSLQTIRSAVTVVNSGGYSAVAVDDSGDKSPRTVLIYNNGPANGSYTVIDGLPSGGDLALRGSELSSLSLRVGSGGNTFRIHDTPISNTPGGLTTTVNTGAGSDTVTVDGTTGPLNLVGGGPNTTVNLGAPDKGVQNINGAVNLQIFAGGVRTRLNVNDTGDPIGRTAVQTLPGVGFDIIRGLAPADIAYRGVQTGAVSITLGDGDNNTFTVENTNTAGSDPTTLTTGQGFNNTVNVLGTTGPLNVVGGGPNTTVNLGNPANRLDDIHGPLTITGITALNVNDQGNPAVTPTYTLTAASVTRTGGFALSYANLQSLTINGGGGGNTFFVQASAAGTDTTLNGGGGNNRLVGPIAPTGFNIIGNNAGTLTGGVSASFSNFQNLTGGSGNDAFLFADGAGVDGNISDNNGTANALDYSAYSTSVIVNLRTGFATGVGGTVSSISVVFGGTGNGELGAYNLLIGGAAGGDTLNGGFGRRNLLVAGGGASILNGGDNDDLLIGGTTQYDTEAGLASWLQIANEWAGSDDYATRLALLSTPGSGVPLLDATTVTGNGGNNVMTGSGELAWVFSDGLDILNGFDPASQQVFIAP